MKHIDQHIVELILRYENVILPKLGCFTKSIDFSTSENHSFSKTEHLSFKQDSKLNDGMLYKYVSIQQGISLKDAQHIVDQYITDLKIRVFNYEKINLSPVGTFILSETEVITFEYNDNFRIFPAYNGLTDFTRQPIIRKSNDISETQVKKSRSWYWAAASLIPILGLSLYFGINRQQLDPTAIPTTAGLSEISSSTELNTISHSVDFTSLSHVNFDGLDEDEEENIIYTNNLSSKKGYQIVLGVFGNKKNALKLAQTNLDVTNEVVIVPYKGMFKVSTLIYSSKTNAQKDLLTVRSFNPKAWLLKLK